MKENTNHKIQLSNPCPMLISRLQKNGSNFHCQSCSKTIIDYSNQTIEEVIANLKPGICGIFNEAHLQPNSKMPYQRQFLFYLLTLLSFFGFNVKPLKSQTVTPKKDSTTIAVPVKSTPNMNTAKIKTSDSTRVVKKEKKGLFRRKKKVRKFKPMGCPDF
ncbi:MAG: hypothetical protein PSX81_01660 [bacterium]|nr:hypothetical protein [bacterium]